MNWAYPSSFWGFLLLIPLFLAAAFAGKWAFLYLKPLGGTRLEWQIRSYLRNIIMAAFTILVVLAAAEPVGGRKPAAGEYSGLDVAVAFDISRSMLAEDVEPYRLSRASAALRQIESSLGNARFSLIIFKGDAYVAVPMTEDRVVLDMWVDRLSPGLSTVAGTNLETALKTARDSFPRSSGRKRVIVLITDGESLEGHADRVVRELTNEGIPLYILAAGTSEGATIPLGGGQYVQDESGRPVVTRSDIKKLTALASATGASCYPLALPNAVSSLTESLNEEREFAENRGIGFSGSYKYRLFLIPSLILIILFLFVRIIPWPKF